MNKKQTIWFWIFLALFIVPEILWSPLGNMVYSIIAPLKNGSSQILRSNFLLADKNINLFSIILFIQFFGLLVATILLIVFNIRLKKVYNWIFVAILLILSLVTLLSFGLSISLRHWQIG